MDDFEKSIEYQLYIKSELWKVMSTMIKQRAGFLCEKCGGVGKQLGGDLTLHVHHLTYKRFGAEEMEDLICVCKQCHRELHRLQNWNR